ncbi:MAG TPA: hypothetical protein VE993_01555 [Stellaceae bacterium]|nr:hypothetical protein [Stellaceae bacterium]
MIVVAASDNAIRHVFAGLAAERLAEMTATAWHDDPDRLAAELIAVRDVLRANGRPAPLYAMVRDLPFAIVGVLAYGPGLGGMIWAARADAPLTTLSGYRWWHGFFVPHVLGKFRRVEFTAAAADQKSRVWLKSVGFTEEGLAYRQGKRGEDFVHFAWLNPDPQAGIIDV